jgi:hypothetical protein
LKCTGETPVPPMPPRPENGRKAPALAIIWRVRKMYPK